MKQITTYAAYLLGLISVSAQVGINTTTPQGMLDVVSTDQGVVVPRVADLMSVNDGNGNDAVAGTIVYDTTNNRICFRGLNSWRCIDILTGSSVILTDPFDQNSTTTYFKASNSDSTDEFGYAVAISQDGLTIAISAYSEGSSSTGIGGNQLDNTDGDSGAVYIFVNQGSSWVQQAYVKASNTDANDRFGSALSLSADGNVLVVGARREGSQATGINGLETNNSVGGSGAAYTFVRNGGSWSQHTYIKASNTGSNDEFGHSLTLSADGNTIAVSAPGEDSNATGMSGDQSNNSALNSGAVYIFTYSGTTWSQEAYIKASNTQSSDSFGSFLAVSEDGNILAVGASGEDSNATGIDGDQSNNSRDESGAVYVYSRFGGTWTQEAYIKASNSDALDRFGSALAISSDGSTLAVGAIQERSNASGINGDQTNNSLARAGAVYVFSRANGTWSQQAYVKASNPNGGEPNFGYSVALSSDGSIMAVSAYLEDSNATGINGNESNTLASNSGAVYLFRRNGSQWSQQAYVKASNTESDDQFGHALVLSANGSELVVGAIGEDSNATGLGGNESDNSLNDSGAVYLITSQ
jgi:hypothetical protein